MFWGQGFSSISQFYLSHKSIPGQICLKCYYDQVIDIHFFTFSCTIQVYVFLTYLAKFQSITNIRHTLDYIFYFYFREFIYGHHNLTLFQGLVAN